MSKYIRVFLTVITICSSCCMMSKQHELEGVAKDWSMTIRASQVIPVYPLTEDMQPGDVFLVQVPIDRQQEIYEQKGFLPLDNMIARIDPTGYKKFYEKSFFPDEGITLPRTCLESNPAWTSAPTAKFPTYSFSVKKGGGFNLALPVQGVPIGLSLMGGDADYGSIAIADSRTYGVDLVSLEEDVRQWAQKNQVFLSSFSSGEEKKNYLRVVNRVYMAGKLNVSIQSGRSGSAGVSAGASKPVDLLVPGVGQDPEKNTTESYTKNLEKLNTMIAEALKTINAAGGASQLPPGATVKIAAASSNSISLSETFPRPVVIGYLGFDMEILAYGDLGPPIPTHALLGKELKYVNLSSTSSADIQRTYQSLKKYRDKDPEAGRLVDELNKLASHVPDKYPCSIYGYESEQGKVNVRFKKGSRIYENQSDFSTFAAYRAKLSESISVLKAEIANEKNKAAKAEAKGPNLTDQLKCNEDALAALDTVLNNNRLLLRRAADYASKMKYGG